MRLPWPLHNNPAELAARTMVQRRNISYATQTEQGRGHRINLEKLYANGFREYPKLLSRLSYSEI